jgi:hypothetical protein
MTPEEKIKKLREIEATFLTKIDEIRREYTEKVRVIVADIEKKKLEAIKKDLGL